MVEFAGWEMPVQYRGVIEEHLAVRSRAGLFDVSHMGEIDIRGDDALQFCQQMSANDLSRLSVSQAQYNLLLNDQGGVVDDVIFYRLEPDHFLICVNAANQDKDFRWLSEHASGRVEIQDVSGQYAQLALQGPEAEKILQPLTAARLETVKPFGFVASPVDSVPCIVARTGYTGEDGFELYCNPDGAGRLWDSLLEAGAAAGLLPAGLGARDTLRLEKAYPLYGHELDDTTTPLEAGLQWVTKLAKGSFMGRDVLLRQKEQGIQRKLIGLELVDPGIARSEYPLRKNGQPIGRVTSGTKSPSLGRSIALGYVPVDQAFVDNAIEVEIRGKPARAKVVPLPFYRGKGMAGRP
jgi:aminomethyltransferase